MQARRWITQIKKIRKMRDFYPPQKYENIFASRTVLNCALQLPQIFGRSRTFKEMKNG
jgi:hypothetical protein